jgi:glycosyltransferase involved in cell wall biosynthesis
MACGTPTIVPNTTCFPETVGDAALQVNPNHVNEITNAMMQIINSKVLSDTLRERGIQRAAHLTWDESARRVQSLLENL